MTKPASFKVVPKNLGSSAASLFNLHSRLHTFHELLQASTVARSVDHLTFRHSTYNEILFCVEIPKKFGRFARTKSYNETRVQTVFCSHLHQLSVLGQDDIEVARLDRLRICYPQLTLS